MRSIIIQETRIRGYDGWKINTTNGYGVYDVLNTTNTEKAQKHVNRLMGQGHTIHEFSQKAWGLLKAK